MELINKSLPTDDPLLLEHRRTVHTSRTCLTILSFTGQHLSATNYHRSCFWNIPIYSRSNQGFIGSFLVNLGSALNRLIEVLRERHVINFCLQRKQNFTKTILCSILNSPHILIKSCLTNNSKVFAKSHYDAKKLENCIKYGNKHQRKVNKINIKEKIVSLSARRK